jgi:GDP-4-dehydro-6-deoxy-D-mannose reductase
VRTLITGASGFAGGYLARACHAAGEDVLGISRTGTVPPQGGIGLSVDLCDADAVRALVAEFAPEVVHHLACQSSVGRSWLEPAETMHSNVSGAVNLLEALRLEAPTARVIWVSTSEVYGEVATLPIAEPTPLEPASPYAISKAAGDQLAGVYAQAYGLAVIRARPFSHAGPEQRPMFLMASLSRTLVQARRRGQGSVQIATGNPDTRRDFTDVRDVVRAYRLLVEHGTPGQVYNVCSGGSVSTAEQVQLAAELVSPLEIEHIVDPAQVRVHEISDLRGSHERLTAATGWMPEVSLRETWADTIAWWERQPDAADATPAVSH